MISIVIPTYCSENNLPILINRIFEVFNKESFDFEIIIVDDNSPDNTLSYLRDLSIQQSNIKVISLSRNFGQQIATSAGLKYAKGDAVVIMDDDLQDTPEFIPEFIKKWKDGYDIVYAIRTNRKEGALKKLGYNIYNRVLSKLSDIEIPLEGGDFCLLSKRIVDILNRMNESDRFLKGLRAWVGYRHIGIECERGSRYSGKSSYTLSKLIKLSLDGIISFSNKPLKITTWFGLIISSTAFIGIIITIIQKISIYFSPNNKFSVWVGFSSIILSILLIGGIQLISIGIIGEYIGRIFNEVKQRPMYLIKETFNIDKKD